MSRFHALLSALILPLLICGTRDAQAQDLYDPTIVRQINITFQDANWLALLRQNYASQTEIPATLEVDGQAYPNVGVRIRGNTSYTSLPPGSDKFSLKVSMDFVDPDQNLYGFKTLNFNNGFRDPTFSREVIYNNFVAQFIPNPRANNVTITLNGENWGVYNNIEQGNKTLLRRHFEDDDGLRISCANNPNGPGLRYNGPNASGYIAYEIQDDGGLANPLQSLIDVTFALTNGALANWPEIDALFAIDPSIWSVVLENLLTDDDSYVNKGCDFLTYTDPLDGRMHLLQRDANETFTQPTWLVTRNFNQTSKPLLNRVLGVAELRQRYFAHYRTVRQFLSWTYFEPLFSANRARLDAAVQADTKKIYSYQNFLDNFSTTVNLQQPGLAGGPLIGLQQFVNQRASFVGADSELAGQGPQISNVQSSLASPRISDPVHITAQVTATTAPIAVVTLHYRADRSQRYASTTMRDDGASGDGAPGDGVFGALLPISAMQGQIVDYYVGASSSNTFGSLSFSPALAERGPRRLAYFFGSQQGLRITEWMYSGAGGEFIELTNTDESPIDLSGWGIDDSGATPGAFDISALGVVQPGESVLITEATAAAFRTTWSLPETVSVLGELGVTTGNNLGRNDTIVVFDAAGALQDRLQFGDQTFPGTIRTQNRSGQPPCAAIGFDSVADWQLSAAADSFGSYAAIGGDIGRPGHYPAANCRFSEKIFSSGFETLP